jgi:hypothetical protein
MLPTFLVIGTQRGGTTLLYELLRQHPDVFLPDLKEPNYLIDDAPGVPRDVAWYESLYEGAGVASHRGDASPGYTTFPTFRGAPARAASLMPDARIVYMLRHPVDRMASAWAQLRSAGVEIRPLETAMLHERHYFMTSCYGLQLTQWLGHFDREQILVLRLDDFIADAPGTLDLVLAHLGLPTGWRPARLDSVNRSEGKTVGSLRLDNWQRRMQGLRVPAIVRALGREGFVGRRFARTLAPGDITLPPALADDLALCFEADMALLRRLLGPDFDLWGLA